MFSLSITTFLDQDSWSDQQLLQNAKELNQEMNVEIVPTNIHAKEASKSLTAAKAFM